MRKINGGALIGERSQLGENKKDRWSDDKLDKNEKESTKN
jgi:hypothetical protein